MTAEEQFILEAIAVAASAREKGNHPFGAILVANDAIVLRAENTVNTGTNPTFHAERNLIEAALRAYSPADLNSMTLYSSAEPCVMCAGSIYWSGIRKVVFSVAGSTLDRLLGKSFVVPTKRLFTESHPRIHAEGPVLEARGLAVHEGFW